MKEAANWAALETVMRYLLRLRGWMKPEVRDWLDGFGVLFAITLGR